MRLPVALALLLFASPAVAAEPSLTFRVQPVERLLDSVRSAARFAGGELLVQFINAALPEKTLDGLDLRRPWGLACRLDGGLSDHQIVFVLPITNEPAFFDLLKRVGYRGFPESGAPPGTVRLPPLVTPQFDIPLFLRCKGTHAFIALGSPAALADAKLPDPASVLPDADELASLRVRVDRVSTPLKKSLQLSVEMLAWDDEPLDPIAREWHQAFAELRRRWYRMSLVEPREFRLDFYFEPRTGTFVTRSRVDGIPDSVLSRSIRDRAKTTNAFAGMIGDDCAISVVGRLPPLAAPLAALIGRSIEGWAVHADPFGTEAARAFARSIAADEAQLAVALRGPNSDGACTLVAAVSLRDTQRVNNALAKFVDRRIDGLTIREVPIDAVLAKAYHPLVGNVANGLLAFGPNEGYFCVGPDAVNVLKDAIQAKAATAPMLALRGHPARMIPVLDKHFPRLERTTATLRRLKAEPSLDFLRLDVEGGDQLSLSLRVGYVLWLAGSEWFAPE